MDSQKKRANRAPPGQLTVSQVAERLGCCEETVRSKYMLEGRLKGRKAGRHYLIPETDVERLEIELQRETEDRIRERLARKKLKKSIVTPTGQTS